jgi:hypothetical protein
MSERYILKNGSDIIKLKPKNLTVENIKSSFHISKNCAIHLVVENDNTLLEYPDNNGLFFDLDINLTYIVIVESDDKPQTKEETSKQNGDKKEIYNNDNCLQIFNINDFRQYIDYLVNNGLLKHSKNNNFPDNYNEDEPTFYDLENYLKTNKNYILQQFINNGKETKKISNVLNDEKNVIDYNCVSYWWGYPIHLFLNSLSELILKNNIKNDYFWLDIVCIDQNNINIKDDLKNLEPIYSNAINHFVIGFQSFNRGWCQFEISVSRTIPTFNYINLQNDVEIYNNLNNNKLCDKLDSYLKETFSYNKMLFSNSTDKEKVKDKILDKWGKPHFFENKLHLSLIKISSDFIEQELKKHKIELEKTKIQFQHLIKSKDTFWSVLKTNEVISCNLHEAEIFEHNFYIKCSNLTKNFIVKQYTNYCENYAFENNDIINLTNKLLKQWNVDKYIKEWQPNLNIFNKNSKLNLIILNFNTPKNLIDKAKCDVSLVASILMFGLKELQIKRQINYLAHVELEKHVEIFKISFTALTFFNYYYKYLDFTNFFNCFTNILIEKFGPMNIIIDNQINIEKCFINTIYKIIKDNEVDDILTNIIKDFLTGMLIGKSYSDIILKYMNKLYKALPKDFFRIIIKTSSSYDIEDIIINSISQSIVSLSTKLTPEMFLNFNCQCFLSKKIEKFENKITNKKFNVVFYHLFSSIEIQLHDEPVDLEDDKKNEQIRLEEKLTFIKSKIRTNKIKGIFKQYKQNISILNSYNILEKQKFTSNSGKKKSFQTIQQDNDYLMLFFSADKYAFEFTSKLINFYNMHLNKKFEIIFVSSDQEESNFNEYFKEMPWLTLPFNKKNVKSYLSNLFEVNNIPFLVVLESKTFKIITNKGCEAVVYDTHGIDFPWYRKPLSNIVYTSHLINVVPSLILLLDKIDQEIGKKIISIAEPVAMEYNDKFVKEGKSDKELPLIFMYTKDDKIRELKNIPDNLNLVILNVPQSTKYFSTFVINEFDTNFFQSYVESFLEGSLLDDNFKITNGLHSCLISIEKVYDYIYTKNINCTIYKFIESMEDYERLFFIDNQFTIFNSNFITITYTWNTNIKDLINNLMIFSKKVNINYLWMDAFCIDQKSNNIELQLKALDYVYQNATYHLCIYLTSLERLWCQYELSIRQTMKPNSTMFLFSDSEKNDILDKNLDKLIKIYNFTFDKSKVTQEKDKEHVKQTIIKLFKSIENFDEQLKRNYLGAIYRYKEINKKK